MVLFLNRDRERAEFLQLNPYIAKLLNNDYSLRNIATIEELCLNANNYIPMLYTQAEINFNYNDYSLDNYKKLFLYMVTNNMLNYNLVYKNCNCSEKDVKELVEILQSAFEQVRAFYIEYFSGILGLDVNVQEKLYGKRVVDINIHIGLKEQYNGALHDTYLMLNFCSYIKTALIRAGKIHQNMSQYEVAAVLYNWVVLHIRYPDRIFDGNFTGYYGLRYGYAVCQGYTAVYNALCKLFGIRVFGMQGKAKGHRNSGYENHIWTLAQINNRNVYIDTTWGRPRMENQEELQRVLKSLGLSLYNFCDFNFFDIPYDVLSKDHSWDKRVYG